MERKILKKRKGQWVTVSLALAVTGLVGHEIASADETTSQEVTSVDTSLEQVTESDQTLDTTSLEAEAETSEPVSTAPVVSEVALTRAAEVTELEPVVETSPSKPVSVENTVTSGVAHTNVGQRDLLKYIIAAEAGVNDADGIAAVTSVIFNRADKSGKSPIEEATAKHQFIVYESKKWQNYVTANLDLVEKAIANHEAGYRMHDFQNFYASGYFYNDGSYTKSKNAIEADLTPYVVGKKDIGGNTFFTPQANFPYKRSAAVDKELAQSQAANTAFRTGLNTQTYTVSRGDTLSKIARANNVTVAQLKEWNNLSSDVILIGQKLNYKAPASTVNPSTPNTSAKPTTPSKPAEPSRPTTPSNAGSQVSNQTYTVSRGDTLLKIARANNVTVAQLKQWNNLSSDVILIGQKLNYKAPSSTAKPTTPNTSAKPTTPSKPAEPSRPTTPSNAGSQVSNQTYTVSRGDTLLKIARANNVTVAQLKEWNNLSSDVILIGQKLNYKAPASTAKPTTPNTSAKPTTPSKPAEPSRPTTPSNAGSQVSNQTYTVSRGDTLSKIARANNVTVAQLKEWNNLSSDVILIGQKLNYKAPVSTVNPSTPNTSAKPTTPSKPAEPSRPTTPSNAGSQVSNQTYTVSRGDTLSKIARANNVTVAQLKEWNNLSSDVILIGQKLNYKAPVSTVNPSTPNTSAKPTTPSKPAEPSRPTTPSNAGGQVSNQTYTVSRGDTLSKIARANNVTVAQLKEWNNLSSDVILIGQKLNFTAPTSATKPTTPNTGAKPTNPTQPVTPPYQGSDLPDLTNATVKSVNYDVKLNGKTEPLRTTLSTSGSVASVQSRFGQRFTVNREYVSNGVTYLELSQNGQVVGYTPKSASVEVPQGKKVIYIDAGHGGRETGAYTFGTAEKDLNLNITKQLSSRLEALGYIVHQSRTTDKYIALGDRQLEPNRIMPDAYISVHHNAMPASKSGLVQGIVSLYHDESIVEPGYTTPSHHTGTNIVSEGKRLAQALQKGLVNATGARDMGAKPQNLHVTRTTDVPATLVELGFQDHAGEFKKLTNPAYQQKLITGLVNGINAFFGK